MQMMADGHGVDGLVAGHYTRCACACCAQWDCARRSLSFAPTRASLRRPCCKVNRKPSQTCAHAPMAQHIRIDHRAAFSAMSADLVASITASSDASAGFSTSASPHLLPTARCGKPL